MEYLVILGNSSQKSSICFRLSENSISKIFQAWSMVLQVFTCSVHQKLFGNAFLKRCSCLSSSCAYFVIQWLNSFFQVGNDQRLPSHDVTGKRSSPLLLGFDPIDIVSVIFGTADVIAFKVCPLAPFDICLCLFKYRVSQKNVPLYKLLIFC